MLTIADVLHRRSYDSGWNGLRWVQWDPSDSGVWPHPKSYIELAQGVYSCESPSRAQLSAVSRAVGRMEKRGTVRKSRAYDGRIIVSLPFVTTNPRSTLSSVIVALDEAAPGGMTPTSLARIALDTPLPSEVDVGEVLVVLARLKELSIVQEFGGGRESVFRLTAKPPPPFTVTPRPAARGR
jgi:hypothetical protein